jgi:hypothetical protein
MVTKTYDVKVVLDQLRAIHNEQTRRLIDQVLELRKLEDKVEDEKVEEDTVDVLSKFLRNFK